ncbi:MAG: FAD-dependent oxidoreductase [Lentisphaeria bacterium]|nr:FAD-dependent oxidoreductase [Lentisphaeria bacterium]
MYKSDKNHPDFNRIIHADLLVVGGGVAGVTAALAAAREGVKTILIHNRPVLGGVSSVEYGDGDARCVNGAYNYTHRNARECGIIEELKNSNGQHFANGYSSCWSQVLREAVESEKSITLLMNTEALDVEMTGGRIQAVKARQIGTEINYTIYASTFIDASGDGFFAASGAEYRMGREGKNEFGESLAPELPDDKTMGSSIAFRAVDAGHPVKFKAPPGAYRFASDADLPFRSHSNPRKGYWWLEYGGTMDTIRDNEKIYRELRNILFGIWDHVKNGGDHGADNYVIDWISPIPGKRESRRFTGEVILTQNDIMGDREFPDAVAYGGWPIDIHPPEGIFAPGHPGSEPPFFFPPLYAIPFRALYSRNIPNLMMAGRNISVSHVALGTTRLMATCALCGQAVGSAAAVMKKYNCTPAEIYREHLAKLRILLQKNDCVLPGRPVTVEDDLCRSAVISASSTLTLPMVEIDGRENLTWEPKNTLDPCDVPPEDRRKGQHFIITTEFLESISLVLSNLSQTALPVTARIRKDDFGDDLAVAEVSVAPGKNQVVKFDFNLNTTPGEYILILDPQTDMAFATGKTHLPGIFRKADGCYHNFNNMVMQIMPVQQPYAVKNLQNDYGRPAPGKPNIWIAQKGFPQWVELRWAKEMTFDRLDLVFDTNLDEYRFNAIAPECIRDFQVIAEKDGRKSVLLDEKDNFYRFRRFDFAEPVTVTGLQIKLTASNGDEYARMYGIHAYLKK